MPINTDTIAITAIALAGWLGSLLWAVASIKSDLKNLTGWMKSTQATADEAKAIATELKGHIDALPCSRCDFAAGN